MFEAEKKAGRASEDAVRVIWETPPYPDYQFSLRGDADAVFGPGFKDKVKQAILALDNPPLLSKFGRSKFISASNEQYSVIAAIAKNSAAGSDLAAR